MKRRPRNHDHAAPRVEPLEERCLLSAVAGRFVFYNQSAYDGNNAAIDAGDDAAIATDKQAYFAIDQLTDNATFDSNPQVRGSEIIWQGRGGTDAGTDDEIFFYDGTTVTQLTENTVPDQFPKMSALGMAWERGTGATKKIVFYDGAETLLGTPLGNFSDVFTLGDNRLAWEDAAEADFEILTWNNTGAPVNLSNNAFTDRYADAVGDNVAWVEIDGATRRVRYFNGTSTSTIGTSTFAIEDPDVSGQNVAWEGFEHTGTFNREIYFYNGTTVQLLTNDDKNDFDPQISGNQIVWWSNKAGVSHIHYYDGSTITQLSTLNLNQFPQIDGNNIVWQGHDGHDFEIFFYDGQTVTQLTDNFIDDTNPKISGNHVVWQGATLSVGTTSEIYHTFVTSGSANGNMTSYSKGINGVMVDLAGTHGPITAADFTFRVGTNNSPAVWVPAPAPSAVSVRPGEGADGSDRIEITWANNDIQNQYLQVTVEGNDTNGGSNTNTGLLASDIFYFGNRIGDTFAGTSPTTFATTAVDEIEVRAATPAFNLPVTNPLDFDKNSALTANDQIVSRNNIGFTLKISVNVVPLPPAPAPPADGDAGLAFALSMAPAPAALSGAGSPTREGDRPTGPVFAHRASRVSFLEYLDDARRLRAGADLALDGASTDEVELPDDVLDALLSALRRAE